ncbi:hypothetical protein [Halalkalibacter nanhaiisediminis]|nr:hypothetical protein [Halalkalibacter nanhaiisediminis]
MKTINFSDLSLEVTKKQLHSMVATVLEGNYQIFWGFSKGKMILNIYNKDVNNKLTFIRHKGFLELVDVHILSQPLIQTLDTCIDFSVKVYQKSVDNNKTKKDFIYQEIDDCLLELHRQKKLNNVTNIEKLKMKLAELYEEWQACQ